jgi:hypothetical protein
MHDWLGRYRQLWDARFEELDGLINELKTEEIKAKETSDGRKRN